MPVVESSGGVRGVVAHWWAGLGPQYTKLQQWTKISFAVQYRVRGKRTLLKENFVCALLLSSVAQSVDSESCMEALVIVIVGN